MSSTHTPREVRVGTAVGHRFTHDIAIGPHRLVADEPTELAGEDLGPAPHDFVLAGLGACTSMTIKMYADRKGWPVESIDVRLSGRHEGGRYLIERAITLHGPLDAEQRARLIEIANKCPVHKTLSGTIQIDTHERSAP